MAFNFNKWLNWNKVTRFKKQSGYFVLPAFKVPDETLGFELAPRLVLQFNYVATKNFTLASVPDQPKVYFDPSAEAVNECSPFILCIKFRELDGVVKRYKLWSIADPDPDYTKTDNLYAPQYTNEVIKKNFTMEIWGIPDLTLPNNVISPALYADVKFHTSVTQDKSALADDDTFDDGSERTEFDLAEIASVAFPIDLTGGVGFQVGVLNQ